jgi:heat shock protein HslJ
MMACRDRMEQEQAFLAALRAARRWEIRGAHLELFDAEGRSVARFEAGAPPVAPQE